MDRYIVKFQKRKKEKKKHVFLQRYPTTYPPLPPPPPLPVFRSQAGKLDSRNGSVSPPWASRLAEAAIALNTLNKASNERTAAHRERRGGGGVFLNGK